MRDLFSLHSQGFFLSHQSVKEYIISAITSLSIVWCKEIHQGTGDMGHICNISMTIRQWHTVMASGQWLGDPLSLPHTRKAKWTVPCGQGRDVGLVCWHLILFSGPYTVNTYELNQLQNFDVKVLHEIFWTRTTYKLNVFYNWNTSDSSRCIWLSGRKSIKLLQIVKF